VVKACLFGSLDLTPDTGRRVAEERLEGMGVVVADVVAEEARKSAKLLVGVARFELATPSSRTRCATRLRYTPLPLATLL
jgi:hypothetical protein